MQRIVKFEDVQQFDLTTDVVVVGFGGAGGSAALEARRAGAEVLVLERSSGGGGSTMLSACEMYLGGNGGTQLQKDLGFDAVAFPTRDAEGAPQPEWLAGRSGANVIIVGDEPLKLKSGDGGHFPADKRLALLKSALNPKPPVQK